MTPDTPLLLFWTLSIAAIADMASGRGGVWRLGVATGLALLSKYTAILFAPSLAVWFALSRDGRRWLVDIRLWAAGGVAFLLFGPVLLWNAGHGWASFAKQGGRAGDWHPQRALQFLGELVGGQIGLATPLIALLCGAGTIALLRRWRDPASVLVAALTVVPMLVFAEHALGDRVQANWPAIVYPSGAIAAAGIGGAWVRLRAPAACLGFVLTALVYLQGIAAPFPLPRAIDPTLARLGGWPALADAIASRAEADHAAFVAVDNYGEASLLAMLLPRGLPVLGIEDRWRFFSLPDGAPVVAGRTGLLVRSARRTDPPAGADWAAIVSLSEIVRSRDGVTAEAYRLYRVTGAATMPTSAATPIAILPRPRASGVLP